MNDVMPSSDSAELAKLAEQLAECVEQQQLIDSLDDGIMLFSPQSLTLQRLNETARGYCHLDPFQNDLTEVLPLYTQRRHALLFDLKGWLSQLSNAPEHASGERVMVWLKMPRQHQLIPMELRAKVLNNAKGQASQILLLLEDVSLKVQLEAQTKLMDATGVGQFLTNAHGYMTQPNYTFCAYTGLSLDELKKMTYLDWLRRQVSFDVPFNQVIETLLKEQSWSGEVKLFNASGAQYYAVLNLSMLMDSQQNIEHFVGALQDITDIREAQKEIEYLAYFDQLTGLGNRARLHQQLEQIKNPKTQDASNPPSAYNAMFYIGLDGFKIINDTHGHAWGDKLLIRVSQKLREHLGNEAQLFKLSGDEFVALKTDFSEDPIEAENAAYEFAQKLLEVLDARYKIQQISVHSSASIGIFLFQNDSDLRTDQMTSFADLAMHEAKKRGNNQLAVFAKTMCEQAQKRLELIEALNHSELDNEFQIFFQAQVDAEGKAISAETLIRWFHPTLGFIPPNKFIPVAEEGRQIIKIGLWVMHKAFAQAKTWQELYGGIKISINISPIQFHEASFVELVIGLLKFTKVDPHLITLELTEGVLIRNTELALQKIQHLVSLGFSISIDDFGTGYSSLSYLQRLPIHELKIDQSFIRQIPGDPDNEAIVDSILKIATTKSLTIVAEGVETEAQADYLLQKQPDILLQGYLYSRPSSAIDFEAKFLAKAYDENAPAHTLSS
jgi:diguanylate cyclase (GGDEF)-like protein/PAS domain S-box-containing protein